MNNLNLQKLIHGYQSEEWLANLNAPTHFDNEKAHEDGMCVGCADHTYGADVKRHSTLEIFKGYFYSLSLEIQQSAKFYIDSRKDTLSQAELDKIIDDLPMFLPYRNCYIQSETESHVVHSFWYDPHHKTSDSNEDIFRAMLIVYDKDEKCFTHDMMTYDFSFRDGSYTFWYGQGEHPFKKYIITDDDENNVFRNESLNFWIELLQSQFITLCVHLNYPEISIQKDVEGRANSTVGHYNLKNLKDSTLRGKPSFEHKTLVLDMYGNEGNGTHGGHSRSSGTAFHSVRKHIRKLPNGKKIFVKAHFRGSKEMGVVTKDYELR